MPAPRSCTALLASVAWWMPLRFFALHVDRDDRWWTPHAGVFGTAPGLGTLRRLAGELKARSFVALLALLMIAQFLLSVEIFASAALFGAIAITLAARTASSPDEYGRIVSAAWSIGAAYAISAVILSPYLYYMLVFGMPEGTILSPKNNAADFRIFSYQPTSTNSDACRCSTPLPLIFARTCRRAALTLDFRCWRSSCCSRVNAGTTASADT